jgi:predicted RecB family nuclease
MRFNASDVYIHYRPSRCDRRVYLANLESEHAPLSPYDEVLRNLGLRHERVHLESFSSVTDLSQFDLRERESKTLEAIAKGDSVIYQGILRAHMTVRETSVEVVGQPDFLIRVEDTYKIRDSKISRRITEKDHPEIRLQMAIYGWLYQEVLGKLSSALEVHNGLGEIVAISYDRLAAVKAIEEVCLLRQADVEPISPVGWSKCNGCPFKDRCWSQAKQESNVALIPDVDQSLAITLSEQGSASIPELLDKFNEESLAELERPWGAKKQRVGKRAESILRSADALMSGETILLKEPFIPEYSNYAVFDLEGMPPHLDEVEKIYLWGLQVFGESPEEYMAATAEFGPDGDREGWFSFLDIAERIFDTHGDIPLLHWNHYEKGRVKVYIERYGDPKGVAGRVLKNLLDLLPITKNSVVLPLPSYSLKVIEEYVGFQRTQDEYGGEWAMAKYIEATETDDEETRSRLMESILTYNREDLEATWCVFEWLRCKFTNSVTINPVVVEHEQVLIPTSPAPA